MRGFRIKPRLQNIDLSVLRADQIDFICTTKTVDRIRCRQAGITFDETLADLMEEKVKHYFVVKSNQEYNVISGVILDPFLDKYAIKVNRTITSKGEKCINHFVKNLK